MRNTLAPKIILPQYLEQSCNIKDYYKPMNVCFADLAVLFELQIPIETLTQMPM